MYFLVVVFVVCVGCVMYILVHLYWIIKNVLGSSNYTVSVKTLHIDIDDIWIKCVTDSIQTLLTVRGDWLDLFCDLQFADPCLRLLHINGCIFVQPIWWEIHMREQVPFNAAQILTAYLLENSHHSNQVMECGRDFSTLLGNFEIYLPNETCQCQMQP